MLGLAAAARHSRFPVASPQGARGLMRHLQGYKYCVNFLSFFPPWLLALLGKKQELVVVGSGGGH